MRTEILEIEEEEEIVFCTCCGDLLNPDENIVKDEVPYPYDKGFGMCKGCGGDEESDDIRKKLGWASTCFFDARIEIIEKQLCDDHVERWAKLSYLRKCDFIMKLIEKGAMV